MFVHGTGGAEGEALDAPAYLDPIATALLADDALPAAPLTLGLFPPSPGLTPLGFLDPATLSAGVSLVSTAVQNITNLFHRTNTDPASQIWKHVDPSAHAVLAALNVRVGDDGKWYDAPSNQLLSSEDADFRAESLMAMLVGAEMRPDRYWYDRLDNHKLTSAEAYARWTTNYGQGATLESVVEDGLSYTPGSVPSSATPEGRAMFGAQTPVRSPGGRTGISTPARPAQAGVFGVSTPVALGIGVALWFATRPARRRRSRG